MQLSKENKGLFLHENAKKPIIHFGPKREYITGWKFSKNFWFWLRLLVKKKTNLYHNGYKGQYRSIFFRFTCSLPLHFVIKLLKYIKFKQGFLSFCHAEVFGPSHRKGEIFKVRCKSFFSNLKSWQEKKTNEGGGPSGPKVLVLTPNCPAL